MSEISDTARVTLVAADFANTDASGKINLIGGGVTITGLSPESGLTAPMTLVLIVAVAPRFVGQEYALELGLYGADGQLVQESRGPLEARPIRIAQLVRVAPPNIPGGSYAPPDSIWPTTQMIVQFQSGLPLAAGSGYEWRVSIDSNVVAASSLAVMGPPPTQIG